MTAGTIVPVAVSHLVQPGTITMIDAALGSTAKQTTAAEVTNILKGTRALRIMAMRGALAGAVGSSAPGCCHKGLPRMCRCSAHRSSDTSAMGVPHHSLTSPRYW